MAAARRAGANLVGGQGNEAGTVGTADADSRSARKRAGKVRSLLLNVAVVVVAFVAITAFQTRNMLPTDRQPAPDLPGVTLAGERFDLERETPRPVLVYFFAPWCKICGASADNLERLRRILPAEQLDIVTVALDWGDADEVREYVARHGLQGPVLLGDAALARDWKIYAFPTYYVLDSQRRVVRRDMGYSTQLGLLWRVLFVD